MASDRDESELDDVLQRLIELRDDSATRFDQAVVNATIEAFQAIRSLSEQELLSQKPFDGAMVVGDAPPVFRMVPKLAGHLLLKCKFLGIEDLAQAVFTVHERDERFFLRIDRAN